MQPNLPEVLARIIPSIKGMECWHVSCGGAAGPTFQLALGKKIQRAVPLKNPAQPELFRKFEGEIGIFVWCAWRLDALDSPLTSSDDSPKSVETGLAKLAGARIEAVDVVPPVWDMCIEFSNALRLHVFCDHVPGEPSFDGNWDVRTENTSIALGPGTRCRVEERTPSTGNGAHEGVPR